MEWAARCIRFLNRKYFRHYERYPYRNKQKTKNARYKVHGNLVKYFEPNDFVRVFDWLAEIFSVR